MMMASNTQDVEKGFRNFTDTEPLRPRNTSTAAPSEPAQDSGPDETTPSDTTKSLLSDFRFAVGIHTDSSLSDCGRRPAANRGIYQRIVKAEKDASRQYKVFTILINGALGLQIIFAAALTALGASGARAGTAVTAFGAMNTVLAAFLTFLKGSGLPNRLKYYHNEWSKVREYIEQRERDFSRDAKDLDLTNEVAVIEYIYENVRKDVEANTPESYVSIGSNRKGGGMQPFPSLARHVNKEVTEAGGKVVAKVESEAHGLGRRAHETEHRLTMHVEKGVDDMENKLSTLAEKAAEKVLDFTKQQSKSD